jgi:hypothetical protein
VLAYAAGARLRGIDQVLGFLEAAEQTFAAGPPLMADSRGLIARAHADFVIALDATLGGFLSVAQDAMRDVLEIEMLLLDFVVEPDRLDRWLADTRRSEFKPVVVRKRLEAAGVGEVTSSVFGADYSAHSETLHVNPKRLPFGGKEARNEGVELDAGFWEMLEHGRRLLIAIQAIQLRASDSDELEPLGPLDEFWDAHKRVMEMQDMVIGLMLLPGLESQLARRPTAEELLAYTRERVAELRQQG